MTVFLFALALFSVIAVVLGWQSWLRTVAEHAVANWRRSAAMVAVASLTCQVALLIGFEGYGISIGGFGQNYHAFYVWGRVTAGLFFCAVISTTLARTRNWGAVLLGSAAVESIWWMIAMAE